MRKKRVASPYPALATVLVSTLCVGFYMIGSCIITKGIRSVGIEVSMICFLERIVHNDGTATHSGGRRLKLFVP